MKGKYNMNNRKKIYTTLSDGKRLEYDVVLTFFNDENKKNYVIYTDNSLDQFFRIRFYAGVYDFNLSPAYIGEPKTKEEWIYINNVLNKIIPNK